MNKPNSSCRSVNATTRSKSATGKVGGKCPSVEWLITFTGLSLIILIIALLVPKQTPEQRLYFRIIIALSASGLAAIIPGFFDINLRWLRSTMRAGGAIGIYLLIFLFNPPSLTTEGIPCLSALGLTGTYDYIFTSTVGNFPNGENQHAGKLHLNSVSDGSHISGWGIREWSAKFDHLGTAILPVNSVGTWQINKANWISEDEIRCEYTTTDKDGMNTGVAWLKIYRNDKGEVERLEGTFKRDAPFDGILGTVSMVREPDSTGVELRKLTYSFYHTSILVLFAILKLIR